MKRLRAGRVLLSGHAYDRWRQRVNPAAKRKSVTERIRKCLSAELRNGACVNEDGGLDILVHTMGNTGSRVWACCYPSLQGGWEVATIIREGWNRRVEERARYSTEEAVAVASSEDGLSQAIEYFKDAIMETDETINNCDCVCSDDLKAELLEQKEHFIIALEAIRSFREAKGA